MGNRRSARSGCRYRDEWEYSLKKIGETAQAVSEKIKSAGEGYQSVDTGVANAAAGRT